jgi:BirA family biotin operon repressor/biotin-[acetyl-CoA-carboxylase] ligase
MKPADHVLELLFDRGEKFYLADDLAREAAMTARRLNIALELLRQRGHELEFSPAHGLRLRRPVNLDAHLVERDLCTRRLGRHVICFDEVDSTNDVAFDCARQKGADGLVVLAQSQRKGRGRHGRRWQSPRGANVLMSMPLADAVAPGGPRRDSHELLTIAAGLAVAEGIEDATGLHGELKWPNDVLVDGAKIAGVLVEIRKVAGATWAVIGIGINANAHPPAGQVEFPATSVAEHTGLSADRLAIARAVLRRLDRWLVDLPDAMAELRESWLERCGMINQRLVVSSAGRQYIGRVLDVSPMEGLVLACDDGRRVHLSAASSTIVK